MKSLSRFGFTGLALAALTLAVLTVGWVYLYTHSRAVDGERQNATLALLKDLKQLDSDWNADVLRSQSDLNLSYDSLVQPLPQFKRILAALTTEMTRLNDAQLITEVAKMRRLLERKAGLVDQFKAKNALLKNSLRYAPTAAQEIQARMSAAGKATSLGQPETGIATLVSEALRYNSVPDAATSDLLQISMDNMRASSSAYPESLREPINNLLAHVGIILRMRAQQVEVMNDIARMPIAATIDRLNDKLSARFQAELAEQFIYQRMLLGFSAFVLLLVFGAVCLIAWRNASERRRLAEVISQQTRELKENELQLVHAQKMNALGEMVAGITHEINTPLAAVKSGLQSSRELIDTVREYVDISAGLADLLASGADDEIWRGRHRATLNELLNRSQALRAEMISFDALGTVDNLLAEGIGNAEYIHRIIVNMLNFSRAERGQICSVKVEDGIDSVLLMANHLLKNARVIRRYGDTGPVCCDIAQINQVLLNLLKNAVQALPGEGGEIIIETSSSQAELRVAITDNGCGIPDDVLARMWEPFFTTKTGSGNGLGLSTCKKIIESHGGRISVATAIGKGTTFTIVLPVTPPQSLYDELGQQTGSRLMLAA